MPETENHGGASLVRSTESRKPAEPCTIVIFGASGDLTARKLIPALYHLFCQKQLPSPFRIIGFARRPKPDADWRNELGEDLKKFSKNRDLDCSKWDEFAQNVFYCQGEFGDPQAYEKMKGQIGSAKNEALQKNLIFYLATAPNDFANVVEHLHASRLLQKDNEHDKNWQRIVVE